VIPPTACSVLRELKKLDFNGCALKFDGLARLGQVLQLMVGLEDLDLSDIGLEKNGCEYVARAFSNLTMLKKLNMRRNALGPMETITLSKALRNLSALEE
jgi:Ran GTPase-activating protein (RanGAP) involved in mRNA processing and transport